MQDTFAAAGHFAQLQTDTGFRTMLSLLLPQLRLDAQSTKLQFNAGTHHPFPAFPNDSRCQGARLVQANVMYAQEVGAPSRCTWTAMRVWIAGECRPLCI
jgi:hypothetical protein